MPHSEQVCLPSALASSAGESSGLLSGFTTSSSTVTSPAAAGSSVMIVSASAPDSEQSTSTGCFGGLPLFPGLVPT